MGAPPSAPHPYFTEFWLFNLRFKILNLRTWGKVPKTLPPGFFMEPLKIFLLLVVLAGCSKPVADSRWCLRESITWLPLIENDPDALSEYQAKVVAGLAEAGLFEEAFEICGEIQDYRRAVALASLGLIAFHAGNSEVAGKALEEGETALAYGVDWQRDKGLLQLSSLAILMGKPDRVTKWLPDYSSASVRKQAEDQLAFARLSGNEIAAEAKSRHQATLDLGKTKNKGSLEGADSIPPMVLTEGFLQAAEKARREGRKEEVARWLNAARDTLGRLPTMDRVGLQLRLSQIELEIGNLEAARKEGASTQQDLDQIGPTYPFKYRWLAQLAELWCRLGQTDTAKELLQKETGQLAQSVHPFFQMELYAQLAVAAQKVGLPDQAEEWWGRSLTLIEENVNPRSRAVGCVDYLLSRAQAGVKLDQASRNRLQKIKDGLPAAYAKLASG